MAPHHKNVEEYEVDPSPEAWVDMLVNTNTGDGYAVHGMSFDHRYGPESEKQLEFWRNRGYPGAENWEIGKPIGRVAPRAAASAMAKRSLERGAA